MEEVLDHNQEAEQIFRQYGRLLELVAAAQLPGRPEDAEECVQDAVWAFVEGRAPWDPAQGSKQTWLCVLVRSRAKDRRRALAARMEEPLEEHSGLAAADHAERAAVRDGLRRVLEGLSREERRLFTLRFVYGLSSAELGGVLGLSPNGVDARVSRLRKKLKRLLARLTATPLLGVLTGLAVTAVLQSSSAATVMVIGFVSAGLLELPRAVAVIYGINIGTTMTAQLIAFDVQTLVYPVLFLGFLLDFAARRPRWQAVGEAVFSFGLLFEGIDILGRALQPLAGQAVFLEWMTRVKESPLLGILLGLSMTMVVQSSSATIALLQNMARQAGPDGIHSVLGLAGAVPVLLGDNIGTTVTALLACIGQGKNAARAALAHSCFNLSGSLLAAVLLPWFVRLVELISPKGPELEVISRQIANAHTAFNVCCALLWLPFLPWMVRLVCALVPEE